MDDGCGCNHEFLNECLKADVNMSKGYGVKNVDQRIKIQFGQEYGIKYLSRNIGTCVEIHLPKIIFDDDIGTA
jgi:two-component system sensor histidine kinase YesM